MVVDTRYIILSSWITMDIWFIIMDYYYHHGLYPIYIIYYGLSSLDPQISSRSPIPFAAFAALRKAQKKQREVGRSNARDAKQEAAVPVWGGEGRGGFGIGFGHENRKKTWKTRWLIVPPTS